MGRKCDCGHIPRIFWAGQNKIRDDTDSGLSSFTSIPCNGGATPGPSPGRNGGYERHCLLTVHHENSFRSRTSWRTRQTLFTFAFPNNPTGAGGIAVAAKLDELGRVCAMIHDAIPSLSTRLTKPYINDRPHLNPLPKRGGRPAKRQGRGVCW